MTKTATKTQRRTAKITTKPYVPAALTRVYDKKTGVCLGYLAPSRDSKETYQVTCDNNAVWHCTCKATVENCCHVKAAKELCEIRVKQGRPACRATSLPEISNEQMATIAAEAHRVADESQTDEAAHYAEVKACHDRMDAAARRVSERNRDLVATAADNAAQAGQAVDKALIASAEQSARRAAAPLNGSRVIGLAPVVAPVITSRAVPMRR